MKRLAIIGAGLSGLTLARRLRDIADITVFEKSRGVGGRMATRYAPPFEFDHGAQYFTARDPSFTAALGPLLEAGAAAPWDNAIDRTETIYVGAPRMNAICKMLAGDLDIRTCVQIAPVSGDGPQWRLQDTDGAALGAFDWVISTAPAPQTAALLPSASFQPQVQEARLAGCFTLMLGYSRAIDVDDVALRPSDGPVGFIAKNSAKPGRPEPCAFVIQSTNEWAEAHLEDDRKEVEKTLLETASAELGVDLSNADHTALHRWRYAAVTKSAGAEYLIDTDQRLAACGDWCVGPRIESAFLSAAALADKLLEILPDR